MVPALADLDEEPATMDALGDGERSLGDDALSSHDLSPSVPVATEEEAVTGTEGPTVGADRRVDVARILVLRSPLRVHLDAGRELEGEVPLESPLVPDRGHASRLPTEERPAGIALPAIRHFPHSSGLPPLVRRPLEVVGVDVGRKHFKAGGVEAFLRSRDGHTRAREWAGITELQRAMPVSVGQDEDSRSLESERRPDWGFSGPLRDEFPTAIERERSRPVPRQGQQVAGVKRLPVAGHGEARLCGRRPRVSAFSGEIDLDFAIPWEIGAMPVGGQRRAALVPDSDIPVALARGPDGHALLAREYFVEGQNWLGRPREGHLHTAESGLAVPAVEARFPSGQGLVQGCHHGEGPAKSPPHKTLSHFE